MVREFMEVEDPQIFRMVAKQSPLVIRRDPFLFAQYFAMMFFINLAGLEETEVKSLFEALKGKLIITRNIVEASSVTEFVKKGVKT